MYIYEEQKTNNARRILQERVQLSDHMKLIEIERENGSIFFLCE